MRAFSEASVLIVGLVRNCGQRLVDDVQKIEAAFCAAKQTQFLIVESDSTDDSCKTLEQLSIEKVNFNYESLGKLQATHPKRTDRIAYCRNHYLRAIKEHASYQHVDYVVVADLDGVNAKLNAAAVASCWDYDNWDVCTANQSGPYYDIWALRHRLWSPNDCWQQVSFLRSLGVSQFKAVVSSVYNRMIRISPASQWIEVDSAFGGLAIYRKESIVSASYVGLTDQGDEVCEHVSLHGQIRAAGGRIFINPLLINSDGPEHSRNAAAFYGSLIYWIRLKLEQWRKP